MLENTKGAMKKGQSRETGNIDKTICVGHQYMQTNTVYRVFFECG